MVASTVTPPPFTLYLNLLERQRTPRSTNQTPTQSKIPLLHRRHQRHTPKRTTRIRAFHRANPRRAPHRTRTHCPRRQARHKRKIRIRGVAAPVGARNVRRDGHSRECLPCCVCGDGASDGPGAIGIDLVEGHGYDARGGGDLRDRSAGFSELGGEACGEDDGSARGVLVGDGTYSAG